MCSGWCVLKWFRRFSVSTSAPQYLRSAYLRVPLGSGDSPDKRRGGTWYLGIQALDEPAEYTLTTSFDMPTPVERKACSRLDRYCSTKFEDFALSSSAPMKRSGLGSILMHGAMMTAQMLTFHALPLLRSRRTRDRHAAT